MSVSFGIMAESPRCVRTTPGTYFDKTGVMRTARAQFLRPEYVYRNGVWIQDGWLREKEGVNCFGGVNAGDATYNTGGFSIGNFVCPDGKGRNVKATYPGNSTAGFGYFGYLTTPSLFASVCVSLFVYSKGASSEELTLTTKVSADPNVSSATGQNFNPYTGSLNGLWASANSVICDPVGDTGWVRVSLIWKNNLGKFVSGPFGIQLANSNNKNVAMAMWGLQIEFDVTQASSLIISSGSATIRTQD